MKAKTIKKEKNYVYLAIYMPRSLKDLIDKYVRYGPYNNQSEFIRAAVREKIQREAPQLLQEIFPIKETNI